LNKEKVNKIGRHTSMTVLIGALICLQPTFTSVSPGFSQSAGHPITLAYPFKLSVNQTAYLAPADMIFRFVNVTEDSRCPSDVQCIWAGQVSILVEYSRSSTGEELGSFELTLGSSSTNASAAIEGYVMKLARVDPYPVSTMQIQLSEYVSTLFIHKGESVSESILASGPVALDDSGETLESLQVGKQVNVSVALHNYNDDDRQLVAIMEARSLNDGGITRFLAVLNSTVAAKDWIDTSSSWTPEQAGEYQLRTFVIDDFVEPRILTPVMTSEIVVLDASTNRETTVALREGQREGPLLVQKIYTDRVEGLNFPEYPVAMDSGLPITLRIGEKASNGCTIVLILTKIQGDSAIFLKTVDDSRPCPICWYQSGLIPALR
jgi:hypothetical protein